MLQLGNALLGSASLVVGGGGGAGQETGTVVASLAGGRSGGGAAVGPEDRGWKVGKGPEDDFAHGPGLLLKALEVDADGDGEPALVEVVLERVNFLLVLAQPLGKRGTIGRLHGD